MVGLAVIAGLLVLGIVYDVFSFDGALDGFLSEVANARNDEEEDDPVTIEGSSGSDQIEGAEDDEVISAGGGSDSVDAGSGDDLIIGGGGADTIFGDNGHDTIIGGAGDDFMNGRSGNDVLAGGTGEDTIRGGIGDDALVGYQDSTNDALFEDHDIYDPDRIYGNDGNDLIIAGSGDTVTGGAGEDLVTLGSWIDPNAPVHLTDYEAGEDSIVVFIPDDYTGAARISVQHHPDGNHSGTILLDGVRIAEVTGADDLNALRASQITVMRSAEFT